MAPKSLKVLVLFDSDTPRPRGHDFAIEFSREEWTSESQVVEGLRALGHDVRMLALVNDITPLMEEVAENRPDVVFNLMEEFSTNPAMVPNVVCVLELLGLPYTGSNPLALRLCKDKALTKTVLTQAGVPNPPFQVIEKGRAPKLQEGMEFPVVVKPIIDDASYGIARASVATGEESFAERVKFLQEKIGPDVIAERYVEGRELYASIMGSRKLRFFPLREVHFGQLADSGPALATFRVKWNAEYRRKWGIEYLYAENIDDALLRRVEEHCKAAYRALRITGYARIDLRVGPDGEPMILEVNPNPNLAMNEDFAQSAQKAGIPWEKLLQMILDQALLGAGNGD